MTEVTGNIDWKWPAGSNQNPKDEGSDVVHRRYYCSTHEVYSYKSIIWLEVDWKKWYAQKKLPAKFRELAKR